MVNKQMNQDDSDKFYMDKAIVQAKLALDEGLLPVGAVIVADGKIIAQSRKKKGVHTYLDHAETMAMRTAFENSTDGPMVTIYSTLEPCLMCFSTILNSRKVERIVYAVSDPYGGGTSLPREVLTPRYLEWWPIIIGKVQEKKALSLFRKFFTATQDPYWQNPENELRKICMKQ